MDNAASDKLMAQVESIVKQCKGSVLITPSRRTPACVNAALERLATVHDNVYLADLSQRHLNPYLAMLAAAEKIFVTNDSVNMISEACCAEKTICILPLLGLPKVKSLAFVSELKHQGLVSMFGEKSSTKKIRANNNQVIGGIVCDIMKHKLK